MPMLGDLLANARDRASKIDSLLEARDPELAAGLRLAASREGMAVPAYARSAVADFSRFASEEDWASLVSAMRDTDDPGTACLAAMVDWRLTVRACEAHCHERNPAETNDGRRR